MADSANPAKTTKVFDSRKINDAELRQEVFAYAEKLSGQKFNKTANPNVFNIKTADGTTINVRSISSSLLPDGSQPRWTIEILKDQKLKQLTNANKPKWEIKFK